MGVVTERLPVLLTREQKSAIARKAKESNMTMGEFLRRAAEAYRPDEDDTRFSGMIEQVRKTSIEATAALDNALSFVAASQKRIAALEARARRRRR